MLSQPLLAVHDELRFERRSPYTGCDELGLPRDESCGTGGGNESSLAIEFLTRPARSSGTARGERQRWPRSLFVRGLTTCHWNIPPSVIPSPSSKSSALGLATTGHLRFNLSNQLLALPM